MLKSGGSMPGMPPRLGGGPLSQTVVLPLPRFRPASIHKSGAAYEEVWRRLVQPEKDRDPDKKGFAVLIKIERAEDLDGQPLALA